MIRCLAVRMIIFRIIEYKIKTLGYKILLKVIRIFFLRLLGHTLVVENDSEFAFQFFFLNN